MALGWFSDHRKDVWQKLAGELGGRFTAGTWRQGMRVDVEHGAWTVTLDAFVVMAGKVPVPFTRLRAPFLNKEHWRLKIYRSGLFSEIGKFFGMQDLEVGSVQFDRDFVIKTNDERLARAFCADAALRAGLSGQKQVTLSVEDHEGWFTRFPPDTDELRLVVPGHLTDLERLRQLFELLADGLDRLCAIGSAYEQRPEHRL
ncbi:MAG: DUF3137 domain-containing protein [Planctomycetes bacterium]|nr:DUF3137 domain-containing protein [Planctomycetota bacterium]